MHKRKAAKPGARARETIFLPLSAEEMYLSDTPIAHRRAQAQFFTPTRLAQLMATWALADHPATLLDPAIGTGLLSDHARRLQPDLCITGVERDNLIQSYIPEHLRNAITIIEHDFLTWQTHDRYDAILANPPYRRANAIEGGKTTIDTVSRETRIPFHHTTNESVLFLARIAHLMTENGRAAILTQGDWANNNYGTTIKNSLIERNLIESVIVFDHQVSIFPDANTTAMILLLRKNDSPTINFRFIKSDSDIRKIKNLFPLPDDHQITKTHAKNSPRWTRDSLIHHRDCPAGHILLSSLATCSRGIATGANSFFYLTKKEAQDYKLSAEHLQTCIGNAKLAPGLILTEDDIEKANDNNRPTLLFAPRTIMAENDAAYIQAGERSGLPNRTLLMARKPWYRPEQRDPPPILCGVFSKKSNRFIYNPTGIASLSTFHGLYPKELTTEQTMALVVLLNSQFLQQMLANTQRKLGGGLSKLEPRDVLSLSVPDFTHASPATIKKTASYLPELDKHYRAKTRDEKLEKAVRNTLRALIRDAESQPTTLF